MEFAFAAMYVRGAADDSRFVEQIAVPILVSADHVNDTAVADSRRACTIMEADLELRDESTDEEPLRQPPIAERTASGLATQIAWVLEIRCTTRMRGRTLCGRLVGSMTIRFLLTWAGARACRCSNNRLGSSTSWSSRPTLQAL